MSEAFDVDARGMKCPWPALRAARAMRTHDIITIRADDPIAERELRALADQQGFAFAMIAPDHYRIGRSA